MLLTTLRLAFVAGVAVATVATATTAVSQADPPTELLGDGGTPIPLKNAAMILKTTDGLRYIAGQQDSNLTITEVDGKLLYVDTGTRELRSIPALCIEQPATKGIAVLCRIPAKFVDADEMFLEVWPRLGDDVIDGSTLPAKFRMWVLADAGADVVHTGAGNDFINGAQNNDRVWSGDGDDWIRTGIGNDRLWGGPGHDRLVGLDGNDSLHGEDGNDLVEGGNGSDLLYTNAGEDVAKCGAGNDTARVDGDDQAKQCESVVLLP